MVGLGLGLGPRARFRLGPGFLCWLGKQKHALAMDIQVRKKRFAARPGSRRASRTLELLVSHELEKTAFPWLENN
jgi:hypothetical protein